VKIKLSFILLLLSIAILAIAFSCSPKSSGEAQKEVRIKIYQGASASSVATTLLEEGLVRNRRLFLIYLRLKGAEDELKAGTYRIYTGSSMSEVAGMLIEGKVAQVRATIPEGSTVRIIAKILEKAGVCSAADFMKVSVDAGFASSLGVPIGGLEGFLFPDTYLFPEDSPATKVAGKMVERFFQKYGELGGREDVKAEELLRQIILASIVEREYRVPSEAGLIASVFKNRLRIGMPLQSCATVVYVITEKLGKKHPQVVYYNDLKIPDLYNTYLHRGLPPGPIANPGQEALKAVLDTPESEYLYFRVDDAEKGTHRFSRSFEEHAGESIPVKGL